MTAGFSWDFYHAFSEGSANWQGWKNLVHVRIVHHACTKYPWGARNIMYKTFCVAVILQETYWNLILSSRFTSIQLYNNSFVLVFILCLWITFSLTALFEIFQMSWTIIAFTSISILLKIDKITANGSHIYHQVACPKVLLCFLITCYLLRFTCKLKSNSKKKWIEHFR